MGKKVRLPTTWIDADLDPELFAWVTSMQDPRANKSEMVREALKRGLSQDAPAQPLTQDVMEVLLAQFVTLIPDADDIETAIRRALRDVAIIAAGQGSAEAQPLEDEETADLIDSITGW